MLAPVRYHDITDTDITLSWQTLDNVSKTLNPGDTEEHKVFRKIRVSFVKLGQCPILTEFTGYEARN